MIELIQEQLGVYLANSNNFLNLPYVNINLLHNPVEYHKTKSYDSLFPPFFTFGNYNDTNNRKVVLLSIEPQKKIRVKENNIDLKCDFFLQLYALRNLTIDNVLDGNVYQNATLNETPYINYQLDYFNYFPALFYNQGYNFYPDAYNHSYWRYIAHIAKGYLNLPGFFNNRPIRNNGWQTLSNGLIELPIFPMSAPQHPIVEFNESISE